MSGSQSRAGWLYTGTSVKNSFGLSETRTRREVGIRHYLMIRLDLGVRQGAKGQTHTRRAIIYSFLVVTEHIVLLLYWNHLEIKSVFLIENHVSLETDELEASRWMSMGIPPS